VWIISHTRINQVITIRSINSKRYLSSKENILKWYLTNQ